jgi:nitroreductase
VSKEDIDIILKAGMSAPSCVNARDWSFIVVTDEEMLAKMADANGRPAEPLRHAAFAVLVCGDLERAFSKAPEYWIIDASIAAENMILAATDIGIGSVWLGTYPQMERVNRQKELFGLPKTIEPHSIIAFGYPKETIT